MRCPRLYPCIALAALALASCSSSSSPSTPPVTTGCSSNTDCSGATPVCDAATKACVECAQDGDCAATKMCQANHCVDRPVTPECTQDDQCADKAKKFCSTEQKCEWQCVTGANGVQGCAAGEECQDHTCVPPGDVCATCTASQYCYDHQRCITTPKSCSASTNCLSNESCIEAGDLGKTCQLRCNPWNNAADGTNASCWKGWGVCYQYDSDKDQVGACVPPPRKSNAVGARCQDWWHPTSASFNDCDPTGLCIADATGGTKTCRKKCDPSTGKDANTACNGNACAVANNQQPKIGFCRDLPATRTTLESCGGTDPTASDYGYCVEGLECRAGIVADVKLCVKRCIISCPTGFTCSSTAESCLPTQSASRAQGESCEGADPRLPSWNKCAEPTAPCIHGVCGRARTWTRTAGQTCKWDDAADAGYDDCATGATCVNSRCVPLCTLGPDVHTGCATAGQICYDPSTTDPVNPGWCLGSCDAAQGIAVNTSCGAGYFCSRQPGIYAPGFCAPLPAPVYGTARLGENCKSTACDASLGLYCDRDNYRCALACDPRAATPACPSGAECAQDPSSYLAGGCRPTATRNENEVCDLDTRRCTAGLTCQATNSGESRCARVCTLTTATPATNPACPTGTYCAAAATIAEGGYCKQLPAITVGPGVLGARCTATSPCDGSKGLFCEGGVCVKACDPRSGIDANPLCAAGTQDCVEDPRASPLGGGCLPKGTRNLGDECGIATNRCVSGHTCTAITSTISLCEPTCNPTLANPGCSATRTCKASSTDPMVGSCVEVPQPTQQLDQSCLGPDPRMVDFNDCADGFSCYTPTKKCVVAHPRLDPCTHTSQCVKGTSCTGARDIGNYYCLDICTPVAGNSRSTCPAGWDCVETGAPGNCIQRCTTQTDCSYGTQCNVQTATVSWCL